MKWSCAHPVLRPSAGEEEGLGALHFSNVICRRASGFATFREVKKKHHEKAPGFERLTGRALGALQRKIETLEAELKLPTGAGLATFRQLGSC